MGGRQDSGRSMIRFASAMLVCLKDQSSYVELSNSETPLVQCCYCSKTTVHEHDILGKVKFDPKHKTYFVSLVPYELSASATASAEATDVSSQRSALCHKIPPSSPNRCDPSTRTSPACSNSSKAKQAKKAVRLAPEVAEDEAAMATAFTSELLLCASQPKAQSALVKAFNCVKDKKVVVIKANWCNRTASSATLLKSRNPATPCVTCQHNRFHSLDDMKRHLEGQHRFAITVRSVSSTTMSGEPESYFEEPVLDQIPADRSAQTDTSDEAAKESSDCWRCTKCSLSFCSDELLIRHENDVHASRGESRFRCSNCLQFFKSKLSFKRHSCLNRKDLARKHVCHLCDKRFLKLQHLQAHMGVHLGSKNFACDLCEKRYSSSFSLKTHKVNAHKLGCKPSCSFCHKRFVTRSLLNRHLLEMHQKDARLTCPTCGVVYLRKDNLIAHIQSAHPEGTSVIDDDHRQCKICAKILGSSKTLRDHLMAAHGILPWNKLPAGKADFDVEDLERELAGSVKCKFCEQTFLPAEMESHLRFSHGVLPFRPGGPTERSISEAAEALLRTLTPQPDYLLRCLTPLPLETLDELIMDSALTKD